MKPARDQTDPGSTRVSTSAVRGRRLTATSTATRTASTGTPPSAPTTWTTTAAVRQQASDLAGGGSGTGRRRGDSIRERPAHDDPEACSLVLTRRLRQPPTIGIAQTGFHRGVIDAYGHRGPVTARAESGPDHLVLDSLQVRREIGARSIRQHAQYGTTIETPEDVEPTLVPVADATCPDAAGSP
jgi:hypothetical protein